MIFLPIVDRELRVAARKRSTFWVRVSAALLAFLIGCGFVILAETRAFGGATSMGKGLFLTLTWMSLAVALSAGLFLTSDCLSEEKREGTLGFLFLTDLRGFDVVLGKLLATSLRGICALLAVFPILAVTLLMGGVTGAQFWKTLVALLNALFVSLSVGLLISAISRDSQKALGGTFFVLALLVGVGPAMDGTMAAMNQRPFAAALSLTSPGYLFVIASSWKPVGFWDPLLVNQIVAWVILALACLVLPRAWQEKASRATAKSSGIRQRWKYGGPKRRVRLRQRLIEVNAVLWLACRERWQALTLWVFTLLMAGSFIGLYVSEGKDAMWLVSQYVGGLIVLVLYIGTASQATRFFVEAKRSGLIELLLGTPLEGRQIVHGNWRALLRMYGPPTAIFLVMFLLVSAVGQYRMWSNVAATATPARSAPANTTTNPVVVATNSVAVSSSGTISVSGSGARFSASGVAATIGAATASILTTGLNLTAICWFGMWMGLTSRSTNLATLKTIVFVQVLPWFALTFAAGMMVPLVLLPMMASGSASGSYFAWYPLLSAVFSLILSGIKDAAFIVWSRKRLYSNFREQALRSFAPVSKGPPVISSDRDQAADQGGQVEEM